MLVHLLHRPLSRWTPYTNELVQAWGDCARTSGIQVHADTPPPTRLTSRHLETAIDRATADFASLWQAGGPRPDVIHTFGVVATAAALRAGPPATVVATFHESAQVGALESRLAAEAGAVIALSEQEDLGWRRRGIRSVASGPIPLLAPIVDRNACADPDGDVVTMCSGSDLDELLHSMRYWSGRLTVLALLTSPRRAKVQRTIAELGLGDRVRLRPTVSAADRSKEWDRAAFVYAGVEDSQHALPIMEAAAHGVPALAADLGANRDLVVSGTTGLLIRPGQAGGHADPRTSGLGVAALLADRFRIKAWGTAALVRVTSAHGEGTTQAQLSSLYARILDDDPAEPVAPASRPDTDALVMGHLALAKQLAGWYRGRGQSSEDLEQVAAVGLVEAARRFDPSMGKEFHSFAVPTILGELRKHFRDNAWAVRVPRGLQETTLQVQRATESLSQSIGRPPTVAEIAEHLDLLEEDVRLAQQTEGEARYSRSLDTPPDGDALADRIGGDDEALDTIELRRDVRRSIARLPEREQRILILRFFGERTQLEIADLLGISQVQVSRVLSRTLAELRDHVREDVPIPAPREAPDRLIGAARQPAVIRQHSMAS